MTAAHSDIVKAVQAALASGGYYTAAIDGIIGNRTLRAFGQLVEDSDSPAAVSLGLAATRIARGEDGTREVGNNGGEKVRQYLASVRLGTGQPWCAAFVYWCVQHACESRKIGNPLPRTGHVLTMWNTAADKFKKPASDARAGDIFIMQFAGGRGHTGFIAARDGNTLTTIEGNTNRDGSREGDGVYVRTTRKVSQFVGVIRL